MLGFVAGGRGLLLLWYWTTELVTNDLQGAMDLVASAVLQGVTCFVAGETEWLTQEFVAVGDRTGFAGVGMTSLVVHACICPSVQMT